VLAFFAFVIWTLTTDSESATALRWFPLWFVCLAVGWLIIRRRSSHAEGYRYFLAAMNRTVDEPSAPDGRGEPLW
jgi:D-serine/D-alanine/glycine transporter